MLVEESGYTARNNVGHERRSFHGGIEMTDNPFTLHLARDEYGKVLHGLHSVSYTHLRAHETRHDLVCRLLLEKKKKKNNKIIYNIFHAITKIKINEKKTQT